MIGVPVQLALQEPAIATAAASMPSAESMQLTRAREDAAMEPSRVRVVELLKQVNVQLTEELCIVVVDLLKGWEKHAAAADMTEQDLLQLIVDAFKRGGMQAVPMPAGAAGSPPSLVYTGTCEAWVGAHGAMCKNPQLGRKKGLPDMGTFWLVTSEEGPLYLTSPFNIGRVNDPKQKEGWQGLLCARFLQ
jgi:hypothetical protein